MHTGCGHFKITKKHAIFIYINIQRYRYMYIYKEYAVVRSSFQHLYCTTHIAHVRNVLKPP